MEAAEAIIFYITAFTAIAGAAGVILSHKIIRTILWAFLSFTSIGILFFALELPYLAAIQIALYAIGTSVVFVFALMLTRKDMESKLTAAKAPRTFLAALGILFISFIVILFLRYNIFYPDSLMGKNAAIIMPSLKDMSTDMFINYGAPFIFSSMIFLSAILSFGVIFSSHKGGRQ